MITEIGRITAIEQQGFWVETRKRSACGSCQAQKGCGHSLLAKLGESASQLWVLTDANTTNFYDVGDEVQIAVPEDMIARGALFIYMTPLICMLVATLLAHWQAANDGLSAIWAFSGLMLGAFIVRWHAHRTRFDKRIQPVLVEHHRSANDIYLTAQLVE